MLKRSSFRRPVFEHAAPSRPKRLERPVVMADCSTMSQPVAKDPPHKNAALLAMAKGKPCLIRSPLCNFDPETTVACHGAGVANGKGMGYKVSDAYTCWGCSDCNFFTDAYGGATKQAKAQYFERGHEAQLCEWAAIAESAASSPKERAAAAWGIQNSPRAPKEAP